MTHGKTVGTVWLLGLVGLLRLIVRLFGINLVGLLLHSHFFWSIVRPSRTSMCDNYSPFSIFFCHFGVLVALVFEYFRPRSCHLFHQEGEVPRAEFFGVRYIIMFYKKHIHWSIANWLPNKSYCGFSYQLFAPFQAEWLKWFTFKNSSVGGFWGSSVKWWVYPLPIMTGHFILAEQNWKILKNEKNYFLAYICFQWNK